MKRFYIKQISASGAKVQYSSVEFDKGLNIIHGPSNTGKSYVIGCINFMFGSDDIPFTKAATGYDTIAMRLENDDGEYAICERKIVDGKSGETGAGKVSVVSSLENKPDGEYGVKNREYSNFLLYLFGIEEPHEIISTQDYTPNNLTVRTFFHFFFLDEEHIFKKDTPLYSSSYKKPTASIMSLLFLLEGKDYREIIPKESAEERERRVIQKAGVIIYLNEKIQELTKRRSEMEQAVAEIGDADIDTKVDTIVLEIETVEREIVEASDESRRLLAQIYSVSAKLEEARFLRDRYRVLRSQYSSDIRRLRFIADGDAQTTGVHRLVKCPFCDNGMENRQQKRDSYIEASGAELERVTLQLQDLQAAEKDVNDEIVTLEKQISELNARNDQITSLINKQLKPRAAELKSTVTSYRRIVEMRQSVYALETMSTELSADAFDRESEEDDEAQTFEPKKLLDRDNWKQLSEQFGALVAACNYPGHPVACLSIDTLDAVVNGKHKKDEGKGYRAFLNTIVLFNLMKFLGSEGTYAPRMLFLDSPILSLKEKKHGIRENEKATPGMRESLFRYIVDNCGDNQIIIAENEIPNGVNYSTVRLIEFTMDESVGRYGFLLSERNVENA